MDLTLKELAGELGGTLEGGDPNARVTGLGPIEAAEPGQVAFLANKKYFRHLADTRATAVLVSRDQSGASRAALIRVDDPYFAFATLLHREDAPGWRPEAEAAGRAYVHPTARVAADAALFPFAFVGPRAEIGPRTALYPGVYVGEDARVGADCVLYPNVVIGRGCEVGDRVTLHPGVSVGADGFGFAKLGAQYVKIPQVGRAVIEDDVEIGANSCVDRATMGVTRVRRGVKMDDLVMVGHNCDVGEDTAIVSQAGVCGSTKIGKECAIGPQVGVLGHLEIGDGVQIVGQSAVRESLEGPGAYGGTPTLPYAEWRRNVMASTKVADMRRRLQRLEREVRALRAAAGLGAGSEEEEDA